MQSSYCIYTSTTRATFSPKGHLLELNTPQATLIYPPSLQSALWSLNLHNPDDPAQPIPAIPTDAVSLTLHSTNKLEIHFTHLTLPDQQQIPCKTRLTWQIKDDTLLASIDINPDPEAFPYTIAEILLPDVHTYYDNPHDTQLTIPLDVGFLLDHAAYALFDHAQSPARTNPSPTLPVFDLPNHHMQFLAWHYDLAATLITSQDTQGHTKSFRVYPTFSSRAARLAIAHILPQPSPPQYPISLPYPAGFTATSNSWLDAAEHYKSWATQQHFTNNPSPTTTTNPLTNIACWVWNRTSTDETIQVVEALAKRLNLPIALDWYWWHQHPYDTSYPDYFPPREGAQAFSQAVSHLQSQGHFVQVYTNGMSTDTTHPYWEKQGKNAAVIKQDQTPDTLTYNTWVGNPLAHICGSSESWRTTMTNVAKQIQSLNLQGLYLDQIAFLGGSTPCHATHHNHPPAGGNYSTQGFRSLLQDIRNKTNLTLTSEGATEHYLDLLDGHILLGTSYEHCCFLLEPLRQYARPIPLFSYVYHQNAIPFGCYASVDAIPPYDPKWPQQHRTPSNKERDWQSLYPDLFALEVARTLSFGHQPMIANLTLDHLSNPKFKEDIDFFLKAAKFYHAHRSWLLKGQLKDYDNINCPTVDVTAITRSIFTPIDQIPEHTWQRKAIFATHWENADKQQLLLLINFTRQPLCFECDLSKFSNVDQTKLPANFNITPENMLQGSLAPRTINALYSS